jgi:hypothetical protein
MKKLEISYEVADGITLANLQECRKYHKEELKKKKKDPSYWIHPEDQILYGKYIDALDLLIDYYGG